MFDFKVLEAAIMLRYRIALSGEGVSQKSGLHRVKLLLPHEMVTALLSPATRHAANKEDKVPHCMYIPYTPTFLVSSFVSATSAEARVKFIS